VFTLEKRNHPKNNDPMLVGEWPAFRHLLPKSALVEMWRLATVWVSRPSKKICFCVSPFPFQFRVTD